MKQPLQLIKHKKQFGSVVIRHKEASDLKMETTVCLPAPYFTN